MLDQYGLIDQAIVTLEKLAEAKGIVRCSYIIELYQFLERLKDSVQKNEEILKEENLVLKEKIKDLETAPKGTR